MKRFISYILVVSALVMIPLICMEIYVESIPNPARDKHQWMLRHSPEVETLVLGSSHTFYGVNPSGLGDNAFNLAMVSQTYRYDCALLEHYPLPRLKYVILPYSYFSIWEDFEAPDQQWQTAIRYSIYMDVHEHSRFSKYGLEMFSINTLWEKTTSLWKPSQLSWDSLGFGTNYTIGNREEEWDNGKARTAENTFTDTSVISTNVRFLTRIADFCSSHNAQLVLITTPTTPSFRASKSPRQDSINKRVLQTFLASHPSVLFLDYESNPRFTPEDFFDSDHLNTDGAQKLTQILRQRLTIAHTDPRQYLSFEVKQ